MPSETTHEDLESVIAEQERKIEELTKQLAVVKTAASGKTQKERAKRSESVSAMMSWNEAQTRCLIDEQLRLSGWEADTQNLRYSKGTRPVKGRNIAISEWPTNSAFYKNGYADYTRFSHIPGRTGWSVCRTRQIYPLSIPPLCRDPAVALNGHINKVCQ